MRVPLRSPAAALLAAALGAPALAQDFAPRVSPQPPQRIELRAVVVDGPAAGGRLPARELLEAAASAARPPLASFEGRVAPFRPARLLLPEGGRVLLRPLEPNVPRRLRVLVVEEGEGGGGRRRVVAVPLELARGGQRGHADLPLAAGRRLAFGVELH